MDSRGRPAQTERSPVGQRIVQARKNAGLSQKELAERLGVTQQSVVVLERRAANVQANTLIKLAEILKVSVDSLLGLEKEPPKEEVTPAVVAAKPLHGFRVYHVVNRNESWPLLTTC